MDTDGSNQVQLSTQPYSEHPAWSPTGKIAFDADGDGSGWQELWTMNSAGSDESQRYVPSLDSTDAWVNSWSPGEADFSGMDGTSLLSIGAVLHKAFVRVDEAGTAASAVLVAKGLPATFRADHPFLFLIRDNGTGVILFLGRVVDPGTRGSPA